MLCTRRIAAMVCAVLVGTGCSGAPVSSVPSATRGTVKSVCTSEPPPTSATVQIISPRPGETVTAGDVTVVFNASGVTLVAMQRAKCPNEYHMHFALDQDVSQYMGKDVVVPLNVGIIHAPATQSDERDITFHDVKTGPHTVITWLAYGDHKSVIPVISTMVTFTVR